MSWLPNPFKSLQLYGEEQSHYDSGDDDDLGSVKEDLSVIGETIGRQLRGVAAFLAPPPASSSTAPSCSSTSAADDSGDSMSPTFARIRSDLAELGGSFKSSLTLLSNNKTVAEFSKMASNFLQLDELFEGEEEEEEKEDDRGIGITDSVLHFVTEVSERPECWTDFPLSLNHGFAMSKAQAEHVAVIVDLVPSLAELRSKLSSEMSANRFWMIYFILLLPRLNRDSVDLLSTPEIVETRSALLNMLLNKRNSATSESEKDHSDYSFQSDSKLDQGRHDPNSSREELALADSLETKRECADDGDVPEVSVGSHRKLKHEDEFSFSDLEDDESEVSTRRPGKGQGAVSYSSDASSEWVRLNKNVETGGGQSQFSSQNRDSEGDESSDWLTIDDFDHEN